MILCGEKSPRGLSSRLFASLGCTWIQQWGINHAFSGVLWVLLFSFHAATCVTNHVLLTHYIRLQVHSPTKETAPWGGLLQTIPMPGKMLLGKGTGNTPPSISVFLFDLPRGTSSWTGVDRWMFTLLECLAGWPQASLGSDLPDFFCLSSQPPSWTFQRHKAPRHGWLMPYQLPLTLTASKWTQWLKSQEIM